MRRWWWGQTLWSGSRRALGETSKAPILPFIRQTFSSWLEVLGPLLEGDVPSVWAV